ncbi:hypothetical protein AB0H83_34385 [Dactylosporangium sp. NPDC050688]|uniref:hypothetical protein n=1 Tax=Dactylosporangium sp. NPDC050688 TaxID=3157217 RepID=UPI0033D9F1C2
MPAARPRRSPALRSLAVALVFGLIMAFAMVTIRSTASGRQSGPPAGLLTTSTATDPLNGPPANPPSASSLTGGSSGPATASPSPPAAPTSAAAAPAPTSPVRPSTPAATRTTTRPPVFTPVVIQAEAPGNNLIGGAQVWPCATCDGGGRVAHIAGTARVILRTTMPAAGTRTVTVTYESDGLRLIKIAANGTETAQRWVTGPGWETPQTFVFTAELPAGALQLAFYNDAGPAPDIDKVVIS